MNLIGLLLSSKSFPTINKFFGEKNNVIRVWLSQVNF